MESKLKHLEFIQNVIARKNSNSFLIKGWTITIVAALFALAAKESNGQFVFISCFSTLSFWMLDSFFLQQERAFRVLYAEVASKSPNQIDFAMDVRASSLWHWIRAAFSKTFIVFYGLIVVTILIVSCMVR